VPRANDIAATHLALKVDDLPGLVEGLRAADAPFVSLGLVTLEPGEAACFSCGVLR